MKKSTSYQKFLIEQLRKDEAFREAYLNEALQDEDQRLILLAIRNVAQATGGMARLAKTTGLNRQNLYRTLSDAGNPTWERIEKIFDGLGYPLRAISKKTLEAMPAAAAGKPYLKGNDAKLRPVAAHEKRSPYGKRGRP
jgi:probable addiction module antidote protein